MPLINQTKILSEINSLTYFINNLDDEEKQKNEYDEQQLEQYLQQRLAMISAEIEQENHAEFTEILFDCREMVLTTSLIEGLKNALLQAKKQSKSVGCLFSAESDIVDLKPCLHQIFACLDVIVLDFAGFRDGRGYSLAKAIQDLPDCPQALMFRATGGVIADSLIYLSRVGFSQFVIDDAIFKPSFFNQFNPIHHQYDGQNSQILPMFAQRYSDLNTK